ncbi:MAG: bifunctional D-glycero-beta-D-manno-heptose-7-phosphate kinase/D-glycero-beta-D-manno-heptose 1-phosphate adenylyltransferase HldE [Legionellales bacterium]|nr:bifunctional D-glycero-beta-D-manno-heptose-7-phosphate kinase/D-glycero-beta-D-manno-heptose 1-phosphate adenylyltransferase HldE [Legionellales bacterium]
MIEDIKKLTNSKVLVVGDVMLDRYWYGDTNRISPEAPVPVIKMNKQKEFPGGAGNVVLNIASLGAKVELISAIGSDQQGNILKGLLKEPGVTFDAIEMDDINTTVKLRIICQQQQLLRLDQEKSENHLQSVVLMNKFQQYLENIDVLILSDYAKGVLAHPEGIIKLAKENGIPVLVDPKGTDFSKYRGASILTPNRAEFRGVAGDWQSMSELTNKALQLIKELDFDAMIVTLGADGMVMIDKDENIVQIPAHTEEVFDVTGAGDTVIALLGCAIGQSIPLDRSMHIANLGASLVVKKLGASSVSITELIDAEKNHSHTGVVSLEELQRLIKEARNLGQKIVMTNGCFDIVHAGHVSYLKKAKNLGSKLIVAINDDNSVKRLKGKSRPVHQLTHRQEVIAELQSVDWVVSFSEDTPQALIEQVLPDVLVKGGDYSIENIVGADTVIANGGRVEVLEFEDGLSTTNILKNLE